MLEINIANLYLIDRDIFTHSILCSFMMGPRLMLLCKYILMYMNTIWSC